MVLTGKNDFTVITDLSCIWNSVTHIFLADKGMNVYIKYVSQSMQWVQLFYFGSLRSPYPSVSHYVCLFMVLLLNHPVECVVSVRNVRWAVLSIAILPVSFPLWVFLSGLVQLCSEWTTDHCCFAKMTWALFWMLNDEEMSLIHLFECKMVLCC